MASKVTLHIERLSLFCALTVVTKVPDEVAFAAEATEEFTWHKPALLTSHQLGMLRILIHHNQKIIKKKI